MEADVVSGVGGRFSNYSLEFFNGTADPENSTADVWDTFVNMNRTKTIIASVLLLFSMATVFGNSLVIAAVVRERYLHTATNYFVTSLAVADCLVGLVVMPFSAIYEVFQHKWFFGLKWCDIWRSLDVLFSTASILNLCVISLDRYWAITDPLNYPCRMSGRRASLLIGGIWICSSAISFPAIVWWRAVRPEKVPVDKCPFTDSLAYLIFSSTISFYLPLLVMVFTYYKIYRAAVEQTRSLKLGTKQVMMNVARGGMELTLRIHKGRSTGGSSGGVYESPSLSDDVTDSDKPPLNGIARHSNSSEGKQLGKNFSLAKKLSKFAKEKKAAKTLGIVMGVFIFCWLPFFVVNLLQGICPNCIYKERVVSGIVTWLGWINSGMNPVIYVCWSKDFRKKNFFLYTFTQNHFLNKCLCVRPSVCAGKNTRKIRNPRHNLQN
ncbi:unnamed protein product [Nesidiocoris tenuis]|uniref:G-protein coupled receptors family 1 profile domain-containing protein n=1 Tax=Nesidiocoris tenuis TaxID=355587 RepID=A0A6H5HRN0_9HEMI|nr:unnamed protein product [Nesidiocoris tenuis]